MGSRVKVVRILARGDESITHELEVEWDKDSVERFDSIETALEHLHYVLNAVAGRDKMTSNRVSPAAAR